MHPMELEPWDWLSVLPVNLQTGRQRGCRKVLCSSVVVPNLFIAVSQLMFDSINTAQGMGVESSFHQLSLTV